MSEKTKDTLKSVNEAKSLADLKKIDWESRPAIEMLVPNGVARLLAVITGRHGDELFLENAVDLIREGRYDEACRGLAWWDGHGLYDIPTVIASPVMMNEVESLARIIANTTAEEFDDAGIDDQWLETDASNAAYIRRVFARVIRSRTSGDSE